MNNTTTDDSRRHRLAVGLTVAWLAAVALGFWWFSARFIVPFNETLVNFDGAGLQAAAPTVNRLTVVAMIDPDCACSGFAEGHWQDLQQRHAGVAFERAEVGNRWSFLLEKVPSSPAVAVWDAAGQLRYFGPFSGGAFCGSGDDFVAMALDAIAAEEYFQWIIQDAVGCFCQREVLVEET